MTRPAPVCVCIFLKAVRLHCLWQEPSCYEETEDGFPYTHPFSYTDCTRHDSSLLEERHRILSLLLKGDFLLFSYNKQVLPCCLSGNIDRRNDNLRYIHRKVQRNRKHN